MTSCSAATKVKVATHKRNMGRKRKKKIAREGSTPTRAAFFGETKTKG